MSTLDEELTECLPEYIAFAPRLPPAVADEPAGTPL